MTAPSVSTRTIVRDAAIAALDLLRAQSTARVQTFDVSPRYLAAEECKRFPTYCVVVTDESPAPQTFEKDSCELTLLIVIYAKHDEDPRGYLDAAIEDVYEAMLLLQATLKDLVWKMKLTDLTADEAATTSHPHAQALQRWSLHHRRRATAA